MIQFRPFKGIRPAKTKAASVATKNIDYYDSAEIDYELKNNPDSFFKVIEPALLGDDEASLVKVRENLETFIKEKILLKDPSSYYIYEQEDAKHGKTLGIIGVVSLDDYKNGLIKRHENTLKERQEKFTRYLKTINLQPDPVLLTFPENSNIEMIISMITVKTPCLEFSGSDQRTHRLWQVKDRLLMQQLKFAIEKLPALYIADGHHRMESSVQYTEHRRAEEPDFFGGEMFNYTLAVIIPGNFLKIYDYNRLVKDLNGMREEEFLEKLKTVFSVIEKKSPYYPSSKHHLSMYLNGKFYALYVNHSYRGVPKALGELDTYLWEEHIMKPILGIEDSRESDKVEFVKGTGDINGIMKMKELVDKGEYKVAFGFYPIALKDLKLVADEDKTMPPKSTYIYPKFLSALTMLDLND
ncbi:DUF1015 domain-containing protein [Ornithobacterium rhinotracheale]